MPFNNLVVQNIFSGHEHHGFPTFAKLFFFFFSFNVCMRVVDAKAALVCIPSTWILCVLTRFKF